MFWSRKTWQAPDEERVVQAASLIHAALGLAGETGEVVDIIKKAVYTPQRLQDKGIELVSAVEDELGDVLYYWVRLCDELGLQPGDIIERVCAKLEARYGKSEATGG